ncbi:MAG: HAMP domain-containing histidine kinase [Deltaproteobacteria bacterium]|nr:MAG: HAMP domain-containing histidine kinase [Deltaproteobacteria bacterium]
MNLRETNPSTWEATDLGGFQRKQHGMMTLARLLPGIVHEFNNPVTYIMSNIETLSEYMEHLRQGSQLLQTAAEGATPPSPVWLNQAKSWSQQEDLEGLWEDIDAMMEETMDGLQLLPHTTQSLREFAKGLLRQDPEAKPLDPNHVVTQAMQLTHNAIKYKGSIVQELSPVPKVDGDPGQLLHAVLSLLDNAALSMADRGTLTVKTLCAEGWVMIDVQDTGCGMHESSIPEAMRPSTSLWPASPHQHLGLGLPLALQCFEQHRGSLQIKSQLGKGTWVRGYLPVSQTSTP